MIDHLARHQLQVIQQLGDRTLKVFDKKEKRIVVLKKANQFIDVSQASLLTQLHHENIVRIIRVINFGQFKLLLFDYVEGGSLADYVQLQRSLSEDQAQFLLKQVCQGVAYLHSRNIVHYNLTAQKILMASNGLPKIYDFEVNLPEKHVDLSLLNNPDRYLHASPEQLSGEVDQVYKPSDLWSLGVIAYKLLHKMRHPFWRPEFSKEEFFRNVFKGKLVFKKNLSAYYEWLKQAQDFIARLLMLEPNDRYTSAQALKHPWLSRKPKQGLPLSLGQQLRIVDLQFKMIHIVKALVFVFWVHQRTKRYYLGKQFNRINLRLINIEGRMESKLAQQDFTGSGLKLKSAVNVSPFRIYKVDSPSIRLAAPLMKNLSSPTKKSSASKSQLYNKLTPINSEKKQKRTQSMDEIQFY